MQPQPSATAGGLFFGLFIGKPPYNCKQSLPSLCHSVGPSAGQNVQSEQTPVLTFSTARNARSRCRFSPEERLFVAPVERNGNFVHQRNSPLPPLSLSSPGGVLRCSSPFRCTSMVFDHAVGDKHRLTLFGCPLGGQERPGSRHSTAQPETRRCDYRTRRPSRQSSRCTTWHLPHLPGH